MSGFTLQIQDATQTRDIDDVRSFVGSDASGSFGLLPGHARLITTLRFGLARFRVGDGGWQYLAVPGAVLYFAGTRLWIGTRRYLLDDDYGRISRVLGEQLAAEEQELHSTKDSLRRMEEALLRRLWQLGQAGAEPMATEDNHDLTEQVERQAERLRQAERDRPTLLAQTVYLGTLGLVFVLPVVFGAYLGRWLDSRLAGYSMSWTISLIFTGIVIGGVNVWLMLRE